MTNPAPAASEPGKQGTRSTTSVEVDIFGTTYKVRSANDEEHLQRLADFVDGKMREIATHTAAVDTTKIAVLAALNIADQLVREAGSLGRESEIDHRVAQLTDRLRDALEGRTR